MAVVGGRVGSVAALWRYPVKSMQGERVDATAVSTGGLLGDRAFALQDVETGKVASAKSPRLWPGLLDFHAAFTATPTPERPLPPVRIVVPTGRTVTTDDPEVDRVLSEATGREVRLITSNPPSATFEQYVPPIEGAEPGATDVYRDTPNDLFGSGTLHDAASLHVLTTATLDHLGTLYPTGRFDARRFRPNIVVETDDGHRGFVENRWLKRRLTVGTLVAKVTAPMLRCVMVSLPQPSLPKDLGILRTVVDHNRLAVLDWPGTYPCVGVAGRVETPGTAAVGDEVSWAGTS